MIDKVGYSESESGVCLVFEPSIVNGHIDEIDYSCLVQFRQFEDSELIPFLQSHYQSE